MLMFGLRVWVGSLSTSFWKLFKSWIKVSFNLISRRLIICWMNLKFYKNSIKIFSAQLQSEIIFSSKTRIFYRKNSISFIYKQNISFSFGFAFLLRENQHVVSLGIYIVKYFRISPARNIYRGADIVLIRAALSFLKYFIMCFKVVETNLLFAFVG